MLTKVVHNSLLIGSLVFTLLTGFAQESKPLDEAKVNKLITTKIDMDKAGEFDDRYTIFIFQGDVQKANSVKARYDNLSLGWPSELKYEQPYHKVYIGKYPSKLEAERAWLVISKSFPNARVLKP